MKKGACLGSTNNLPHCHLVHTQREREREREREKHDISVGNKYRHTTRNQVSGKGKERKKEASHLPSIGELDALPASTPNCFASSLLFSARSTRSGFAILCESAAASSALRTFRVTSLLLPSRTSSAAYTPPKIPLPKLSIDLVAGVDKSWLISLKVKRRRRQDAIRYTGFVSLPLLPRQKPDDASAMEGTPSSNCRAQVLNFLLLLLLLLLLSFFSFFSKQRKHTHIYITVELPVGSVMS